MLKNRIKIINKKAVAIISVLMIIFITYNVFFRNSQAQALSKYGSRGNEVTQIQTGIKFVMIDKIGSSFINPIKYEDINKTFGIN